MEKSANRLWKESGTTLSFKDWLNREKSKFMNYDGGQNNLIVNVPLNDSVQKSLAEIKKSVGYKDEPERKTVFGINKTIIIVAGVAIVAFAAYKIIKSKK